MSPIARHHAIEADVLTEVGRLLRTITFTAERGGYTEVRDIAVWVEPRVDEDTGERYVFVGCHVLGQPNLAWQGTPIFLCRADTDDLADIWLLNARGAASGAVDAGFEYYLSTSPTHAVSAPAGATDAEGAAAVDVLRGEFALRGGPAPPVDKVVSADGRVTATIVDQGASGKAVVFETEDVSLVGRRVRFAFREEAGGILQRGAAVIVPVGAAGAWVRVPWPDPKRAARLVFEVWDR